MIVTVLKAGIYADPDMRALPYAEVGDVIEVHGGWYAESLISDGFVEVATNDPTVPEVTKRGRK